MSLSLENIVNPQYLSYYHDWQRHASEKQKKGIYYINIIYKNKGRKKIKRLHHKNYRKWRFLISQSKEYLISITKAEEIFRKNQITTSYYNTFGYLQRQLKPQNNVFKFKKVSQLQLSKPLSDLSKLFLDNWVQLNDQLQFQQSLLSRLQAQQVPISETKQELIIRDKYRWKVDWKLSKPIRLDRAGSDLNTFKPNYNAIFKQRMKQEKIKAKLQELQKSQFVQKLKIFKSFKIT